MTWYLALVGVVLIGMMAMINLMTNHFISRLDDMQRRAERMGETLDVIKQDLDLLRMQTLDAKSPSESHYPTASYH